MAHRSEGMDLRQFSHLLQEDSQLQTTADQVSARVTTYAAEHTQGDIEKARALIKIQLVGLPMEADTGVNEIRTLIESTGIKEDADRIFSLMGMARQRM